MKIERQWLVNRLKAMSVQEIVHRCCRLVRYGYDSVMFRYGWVSQTGVNLQAEQQDLYDANDAKLRFVGTTPLHNFDHFRALWLNNTVQFFDANKQFTLGEPVQWRVDPKTHITTPLRFGRSIDYRDDQTVGEIKYLWELGRHQFLVPMAICVAADNDEQVKARLASHLSSWMEQNPIGMGIHWCSALELSLRLISWSFIHSILQSGGMKNGIFDLDCDAELLGVHIHAQATFVASNYSRHSSSNNHLIGELVGVWMACNVFDLGEKGRRLSKSAFAELHSEIRLQTHDDGVNKEQAIYYHLWSLEYFWLAWSIAKRYEQAVSVEFEEHLVAMVVFLQSMCASTDLPSQIGDADGGVVCRFSPDINDNVYQSLLEAIEQILDVDTTPSIQSTGLYCKSYWYQQIVERADVSTIADIYRHALTKDVSKQTFELGGYFVLQAQDSRMLFKSGPFGYLSTGAHGHADALSVTLALDGHWWLIDPGTYTYHSSGEWRNHFRSTAAHNTVCINQSNQSDIAGDFLWSRRTDAQVHRVESQTLASTSYLSKVSGSHPGYEDQGVKHARTVTCDAVRTFEIHDEVVIDDKAEACDLQLSFHFHPDITLKQLDTHRWLATRQNSESTLSIELSRHVDWTVEKGNESPIVGWYSETYGVKTPSQSLLGRTLLKHGDRSQTHIYRTLLVVHDSDGCEANAGVVR